jgi:hypothetical protein
MKAVISRCNEDEEVDFGLDPSGVGIFSNRIPFSRRVFCTPSTSYRSIVTLPNDNLVASDNETSGIVGDVGSLESKEERALARR